MPPRQARERPTGKNPRRVHWVDATPSRPPPHRRRRRPSGPSGTRAPPCRRCRHSAVREERNDRARGGAHLDASTRVDGLVLVDSVLGWPRDGHRADLDPRLGRAEAEMIARLHGQERIELLTTALAGRKYAAVTAPPVGTPTASSPFSSVASTVSEPACVRRWGGRGSASVRDSAPWSTCGPSSTVRPRFRRRSSTGSLRPQRAATRRSPCAQLAGAATANGTPDQRWVFSEQPHQKWTLDGG
jgi:hypothetical protein